MCLELAADPRRKPGAGSGTLRGGPLRLLPGAQRAMYRRLVVPLVQPCTALTVSEASMPAAPSGKGCCLLRQGALSVQAAPPWPLLPPCVQTCLSMRASAPRCRAWAPVSTSSTAHRAPARAPPFSTSSRGGCSRRRRRGALSSWLAGERGAGLGCRGHAGHTGAWGMGHSSQRAWLAGEGLVPDRSAANCCLPQPAVHPPAEGVRVPASAPCARAPPPRCW